MTGFGHVYCYDSTKRTTDEEIEELIESFGHQPSNCQWMTTDEDIIIH